jgi:lysozyme
MTMKLRYGISPAAIELIKRFEGFRRTAAQLEDGGWTIGYGHTRSARAGAEVTEADAEALLGYDLVEVQAAVNDWTFTPLTQNQFDALTSFAFNISLDAFRHSSVLRRVNEGAMLQAACAMEMWRKADFEGERIVVDALIRRRAAEKALFLTPEDGFVAAPSAVLRPQLDYDAGAAVPRVRPTELKTDLEGDAAGPFQGEPPSGADGPVSSSERAAAAVSARLQAIWPREEALPEAAEPVAAEPDEPEPFPAGLPPSETEASPPPQARPASATMASVRSIFDQTRDEPERPGVAPLVVLGLIGLLLFGGGLYWAFNARPSGSMIGSAGFGFVLGLLGIACVASAVYFLLERLADEGV